MGNTLTKGTLFPVEQTNEMISLVKGKSSLAKLSASEPVPFNGKEIFTFTLDKEVDLVAENGAKSNGGATVAPVQIIPHKVEYGVRVSDEFIYAAEEKRLAIMKQFIDGFAKKAARGLDIMAFHGVNPRTGSSAITLGTEYFEAKVNQVVTYDASAPQDNVEDAISLIEGNEYDLTGMAMAPAFKNALKKIKTGANLNTPLFPELGWGKVTGNINGLPVDSNSTVSFGSSPLKSVVGDFEQYFRWGYAKEVPFEVIRYGNPDNDAEAGDLAGHNQVYLRAELYMGWAILVPEAFAVIKSGVSG